MRTPKHILFDLGLTEEEAIALFKHLLSEIEEESYQASQKMFEDVAKRCGYKSYADYLMSQTEMPWETVDEEELLVLK